MMDVLKKQREAALTAVLASPEEVMEKGLTPVTLW